jgi:hypothetical protein
MPEKMKQGIAPDTDDGQRWLKKAIIAFAIIEALVLIPVVLYLIFR